MIENKKQLQGKMWYRILTVIYTLSFCAYIVFILFWSVIIAFDEFDAKKEVVRCANGYQFERFDFKNVNTNFREKTCGSQNPNYERLVADRNALTAKDAITTVPTDTSNLLRLSFRTKYGTEMMTLQNQISPMEKFTSEIKNSYKVESFGILLLMIVIGVGIGILLFWIIKRVFFYIVLGDPVFKKIKILS